VSVLIEIRPAAAQGERKGRGNGGLRCQMFQAIEPDQAIARVCLTVELRFRLFNCPVREGEEGTRNGAVSLSLRACVPVCAGECLHVWASPASFIIFSPIDMEASLVANRVICAWSGFGSLYRTVMYVLQCKCAKQAVRLASMSIWGWK
jgi:hypothetical protein